MTHWWRIKFMWPWRTSCWNEMGNEEAGWTCTLLYWRTESTNLCQPWEPLLSTVNVCLGKESEKHQITESGCCTPKQAKNRETTGDQHNPNSGLKTKRERKRRMEIAWINLAQGYPRWYPCMGKGAALFPRQNWSGPENVPPKKGSRRCGGPAGRVTSPQPGKELSRQPANAFGTQGSWMLMP